MVLLGSLAWLIRGYSLGSMSVFWLVAAFVAFGVTGWAVSAVQSQALWLGSWGHSLSQWAWTSTACLSCCSGLRVTRAFLCLTVLDLVLGCMSVFIAVMPLGSWACGVKLLGWLGMGTV
jgi:hypothetical protein